MRVHIYTLTYIYLKREREREREILYAETGKVELVLIQSNTLNLLPEVYTRNRHIFIQKAAI